MTTEPAAPQQQTLDERKALLAQQVQMAVGRGMRIDSQSDTMAVVVSGKPINHILHLILTLVTFGFWGIVWVILIVTGGEDRQMLSVDEYGNVLNQKA